MKSRNLELALRQFEISDDNDTISYIDHFYNGFSGAEGSEAYYCFLEQLYNDYFLNLRTQIDNLILQNIEIALNFVSTKIVLFNDIQNDFKFKSTLEFWLSNKDLSNDELNQKEAYSSLWKKIKNQRDTIDFFIGMIETQEYFINKALLELLSIKNSYSSKSDNPTITENEIDIQKWENLLKNESEILSTFDLARIFNKASRTINRWVKEGAIVPIDKNKKPQQFKKDDIKKYYLKVYQK